MVHRLPLVGGEPRVLFQGRVAHDEIVPDQSEDPGPEEEPVLVPLGRPIPTLALPPGLLLEGTEAAVQERLEGFQEGAVLLPQAVLLDKGLDRGAVLPDGLVLTHGDLPPWIGCHSC